MTPISILQLEDSDLDADLEMACLRRAGIEVQSTRVERRAEFAAAIESKSFDLILADFHLPDIDGLEALAIARKKAPRTPFILVSGVLGEETAIDVLRSGATDYVQKTRMERLAPAVQRAVSEAREHAHLQRIEAALAESENRFRNMADFAPVMIWTADTERNWNYCNRPWLEFTGFTIEQSSGSGWTDLIHPQDRVRVLECYHRAYETREEFTLEYRLRRADGEYRSIINRAVPRFLDETGFAGFIGSCTDNTDLKIAEERLRHAAKLESLGILAGGIAHDFNNLLSAILANATLVLEEMPPGSRAANRIQHVVRASEAAAALTGQMLAYSGKGHFVLEKVNFSQVVRRTLPLIEVLTPRVVEIDLHLEDGLPSVESDLRQIEYVVMNVIINAVEAASTNEGGVVNISTKVEDLDAAGAAAMLSGFAISPGRYLMLRVHDNGPGMDAETKTRIFDPFFSTKFAGRGLGLAAVSGILRGHRGGISLTSETGQGADFRVYFPISTAEHGPEVEKLVT